MKHVFSRDDTKESEKDRPGVDRNTAIDVMSQQALKLGYTFEQLARKVQFEVERNKIQRRRHHKQKKFEQCGLMPNN